MSKAKENRGNGEQHLMISGVLALHMPGREYATVERGMPILSREGQEVGKVAAVTVNKSEVVDAILLSRLTLAMEYRLVPAGLVAAVRDYEVVLDLAADGIDGLGKWSSG